MSETALGRRARGESELCWLRPAPGVERRGEACWEVATSSSSRVRFSQPCCTLSIAYVSRVFSWAESCGSGKLAWWRQILCMWALTSPIRCPLFESKLVVRECLQGVAVTGLAGVSGIAGLTNPLAVRLEPWVRPGVSMDIGLVWVLFTLSRFAFAAAISMLGVLARGCFWRSLLAGFSANWLFCGVSD